MNATSTVRPGEELELARLTPYLAGVLGTAGPFTVEQFPSGHSNLTYLVRAGGRDWVLRRPPFGSQVKTAHDMGREFRILSALHPIYPRVPRPIAFCEDETILGAKFYLMERLAGVILRREPEVPLDAALARRVGEALVDALVELHALDWEKAGLGSLGRPEGYLERQIHGWTERYRAARTDELPEVETLAAWLAANRPASPPPALIHNDFKHDNVVLDPKDLSRVVGVLDWEMATIGDPLADLGTALSYWVEAGDPPALKDMRFGPTTLPGNLTRQEVIERYQARSGRDVARIGFYYRFGLFKTAVVAQQIYFRYRKGLTKDPRFGALVEGVRALTAQALSSPA